MAVTLIGITPLRDRIIVAIYDDGDTTRMLGGKKFYTMDDTDATGKRDMHTKHIGIRDRWALVLAISDTVEKHGDIAVGDKVRLTQLEWTRGMIANIHGFDRGKVWSILETEVRVIDHEGLDDAEKLQMTRLYPDWEQWEAVTV